MGEGRAQVNKPHKSRFASKSSRHAHRVDVSAKPKISKRKKQGAALKGARAARIQRNKAIRDQKRVNLLKEKRVSTGPTTAPRVVVLFGLTSSVNTSLVAKDLLNVLLGEDGEPTSSTVASSTYKVRIMVLQAPHGDIVTCMEMAKVADLIAFVVSANSLFEDESGGPIDEFGKQCLSVFKAVGLPSTTVLIRDLPSDLKLRQDMKRTCMASLSPELPEDCKFHAADTKDDIHKFMWLFKEQSLSSPHWRSQRSYLLSEEVQAEPYIDNPETCTLFLSGYLRAHGLSVNQLVHVSGAGDFQMSKIDILKDPFPITERKRQPIPVSDGGMQVINSLIPDPMVQEPLLVENVPDPLSGEQTWPTEAEMAEAAADRKEKSSRRKLPKGTSAYQASWIVDDSSDENVTDDDNISNVDDDEGNDAMLVDGQDNYGAMKENDLYSNFDTSSNAAENFDSETIGDNDMDDDVSLTKEQLEDEIKKIKAAKAEDEEFPDEVDTPLDVPAKKRFARYRGLKSFKTSTWDPKESLPFEYAKIFAFDNFAKTQKHVVGKMLTMEEESPSTCTQVGSYVRLHVKNVPTGIASRLCQLSKRMPLVACGLLQHESKMSVLHFSIKLHDSYDAPVKAKEPLVFHVGFRTFNARPLFSSDNIYSNKYKMERFLQEGRFSIASIYAPICFPSLPLVVMKKMDTGPAVVATGSLKSINPDRIIVKRIILTGYPQRVSKLKAVVRYMFHNPEDVRWFKPVDVWTKYGRHGRIKEAVGTHGAMKCIFNAGIQQHDTVCMSLYKRVYPKWPEQIYTTS